MKFKLSIALFSAILPLAAVAQGDPTLAPPTCNQPEVPTASSTNSPLGEMQNKRFEKEYTKYHDCILAYQEKQMSLAQQHQNLANKAVKDYNEFVKKINAERSRAN